MAKAKSPKKTEAKDQAVTKTVVLVGEAVAVPATVKSTVVATPATAITSAEPRRLEIVKPDSRANIVPINIEDEIRALAYELSSRRGFIAGRESEDWLAAEREVRQRYHQRSA